jgi:hypothetical protein
MKATTKVVKKPGKKAAPVQSVRRTKYSKAKVLKVIESGQYNDHTKAYLKRALIDGLTYQAAGDEFGVSRQLVYKRAVEVLRRSGVDLTSPKG